MVDVAEVDLNNADYLDMFAYSSHLADSGKCSMQYTMLTEGILNFNKVDWLGIVRDMVQMQYDDGNLAGYVKYKQFLDFLEQ